MNKTTLDFVQLLSKRDTKNLSQKTLKIGEELGELSKKILPYDNAYATRHRFVVREGILEEVADIMLCAMSVAYDLGFEHEDVEKMLLQKSTKWAGLQDVESLFKFPCPFEIHVTVDDKRLDLFERACKELSKDGKVVKPTKLYLQDLNGKIVMNDTMTSEVHIGDNRSVLTRLEETVEALQGCKILRRKIETVPWHPAAPSETNGRKMPHDCYFETHFELDIAKRNVWNWTELTNKYPDLAFSVNVKRINTRVGMTLRDYEGTYETHDEKVSSLRTDLGVDSIIEQISEFAIYDTSILHDNEWMKVS